MEYFCPVCGCPLDMYFEIGIICPCCGNQGSFDDDIDKIELIKKDESNYWDTLKRLQTYVVKGLEVPKEITDYLDSTKYTKEEAFEILRNKWINGGFKWKWNDKNEKPNNWNKEMAIKQLENIGVCLEKKF